MITELPPLVEAAEAIRAKRLAPLELVECCLDRIRKWDERIHAWVLVDESGARRAAEQAASEIRHGHWRGPLHGVPLGVKDIIDVAGLPTKAGSPLRENHLAEKDAPLVARLRECGAIVLGKTVTTEFAGFDPPETRNPWNLDHTPGGSSSGSAAALAAGMCPLALGSQTGGSITRPAAFCGVAGLKPRYGVLPLEGIVPLAYHLDHPGPLARTAADLRVFWHAYHGAAHGDSQPIADWTSRLGPPRLVKLEGYFWNEAAPDVRASVDAALATLARAGAEIAPYDWSEITQVHSMHRRIMAVEAAEFHRSNFAKGPASYKPKNREIIEEGLAISAVDYAAALAAQRDLKFRLRETLPRLGADAFVLPATSTTAPGRESTGDPKFNSPWSYSGLPVVNIPCGLAPNGLPCGLQLVGLADEFPLLDVAVWCEHRLGFSATPEL
jgi:Asp-tRNA(Asn)/Glu-tRNA(Gln) amidotransferase A subunit family amidase